MNGEMDKSTTIIGDINTFPQVIDTSNWQKISKNVYGLNTINLPDLNNIY